MTGLYFKVGQVTADKAKPDDRIVVGIPALVKPAITATYAAQAQSGWNAVFELGSPKAIAAYLAAQIVSGAGTGLSEEKVELEKLVESLKPKVGELAASSNKRMQLAIDYLAAEKPGIFYGVREKIRAGVTLKGDEFSQVATTLANVLRQKRGKDEVTRSVRNGIQSYLERGAADEATLSALEGESQQPFAEHVKYLRAKGRLEHLAQQGTAPAVDAKGLEGALLPVVEAIASGDSSTTKLEYGRISVDVYQLLLQLTGAKAAVGRYLVCPIDGALEKGSNAGLLSLLTLKAANGSNGSQSIPEELKSSYLTTQKFAQLITVLDRTLAEVVTAFFWRDRQWWADKGIKTSDDELIRALLSNNPATKVLYPAERVAVPGNNGLSKAAAERIAECYINGSLAKLAAEHIGISEQTLSQENLARLINTLDQLMPLLPFGIYDLIVTDDRIDRLAQVIETEKIDWIKQKNATVQHIAAVKKAVGLKQSLLNNFGYDSKKVPDLKDACIKECMDWLGPGFSFIEGILLRKSTMLSPV